MKKVVIGCRREAPDIGATEIRILAYNGQT